MLGPTLDALDDADTRGDGDEVGEEEDDEDDEDVEDDEDGDAESRGTGKEKDGLESRFPKLPEPQNVFRCPPVNWAKYHVVGESLDKLHEEQMKRPSEGEPQVEAALSQGQGAGNIMKGQVDHLGRAPESVIARPYSMFEDGNLKGPGKGG